ncbi:MAG: ribonuclease III [Oscillospiraceae bacterium]|jgi:ribonuclease-3|nr:ribonuclease III [Oscillospiraceae bacterium]
MAKIEEKMEYEFRNPKYLQLALTHSSYANSNAGGLQHNERLEFLGDSILSVVVTDYLFTNFPDSDEGELTKLRASLVCEKSLYSFALKVGLNEHIKVNRKELCKNPSVLADAFEALIAAVYLDSGMNEAKKFILRFVEPALTSGDQAAFVDYKTFLQEITQQNPKEKLEYFLVGKSGPAHNRKFTINVRSGTKKTVLGTGMANRKKEAEQKAAKEALKSMGYDRKSLLADGKKAKPAATPTN